MGIVYLARERREGRSVAIKLLGTPHVGDIDAARRFAREARTVAALDHPHVVRTLAIEELSGGAIAIVSEYVPGRTLRALLRTEGPLSFDRAALFLRDVASALAYAHSFRIVHRDVKPENIFVKAASDVALLADFGIARALDTDTQLTSAGSSLGTPSYMAPEQVRGDQVDERADVYALGLVGWEMLTGSRPWEGQTLYDVLHKQQHERLPSLIGLRPDIPAYLLVAIDGALAKPRGERWSDGAEFLDRLTPRPTALPLRRPPVASPDANDATVPLPRGGDTLSSTSPTLEIPPRAPTPGIEGQRDDVTSASVQDPTTERGSTPTGTGASIGTDPRPGPALGDTGAEGASHDGESIPEDPSAWDAAPATAATSSPDRDTVSQAVSAGSPVSRAAGSPRLRGRFVALATVVLALVLVLVTRQRDRTTGAPVPDLPGVRTSSLPGEVETRATAGVTVPNEPPPVVRVDTPARTPGDGRGTRPVPPSPRAAPPSRGANQDRGAPAAARADTTRTSAVESDARCRSPAAADQRACLLAQIDRNDVALTRTYRALIARLRREAGGVAEPPAVQSLRAEQRRWIAQRDRACRSDPASVRSELWGAERVPCFARLSAERDAELARRLLERGGRE